MHTRLHHHTRLLLHHAWLLVHLWLRTSEQLVNLLQLLALLITQLANESQHSGQINLLLVEGFLNERHRILNSKHLGLELN